MLPGFFCNVFGHFEYTGDEHGLGEATGGAGGGLPLAGILGLSVAAPRLSLTLARPYQFNVPPSAKGPKFY